MHDDFNHRSYRYAIDPRSSALFTLRVGTNFTSGGTNDLADTALSCTINAQLLGRFPPRVALSSANALFDVSVTVNGDPLPSPSNVVVALVCQ